MNLFSIIKTKKAVQKEQLYTIIAKPSTDNQQSVKIISI
jgi:hypothetical protein